MTLTPAHIERAAALEQSQARVQRLLRMSAGQIHVLLSGDPVESAQWIRSAAECGIAAAQISLGRLLLEGRGVELDPISAIRWFKRACDSGNAEALNMVGRCYENGWGAEPDLARAADFYRRSAQAGNDWGQYNFGNLLFDGRGLLQDQRAAFCWYLLSAQQGHARAMNLVGRCLEEGWGCHASLEEARYWYKSSAERGYFRAQFNHALILLETGQSEGAAEWFLRSARGGNTHVRRAIIMALRGLEIPVLRRVTRTVRKLLQSPGDGCEALPTEPRQG